MFPSVPLTFDTLLQRLIAAVRLRISNGDFTERGLARLIGISQPHLHHILKGMRMLTPEIADSLLATLSLSVLDLLDESLLGQTLLDRQCLPGAWQHLPLLQGCLGPGSPFPDWRAVTQWVHAPSMAWDHVRRPALVQCSPDPGAGIALHAHHFALIDQDEAARLHLSPQCWYALRWRGAGFIRQIRLDHGAIAILGQTSFESSALPPAALPPAIDLNDTSILNIVRARVVWLGRDPRCANPFGQPADWLPAPTARS